MLESGEKPDQKYDFKWFEEQFPESVKEIALVENLQQKDINEIDQGKYFLQLQKDFFFNYIFIKNFFLFQSLTVLKK